MRLLAALVGLAVFAAPTTALAQQAGTRVQVQNNVYTPADVRVAKGEVVSWTLLEGKHSVSSDLAKWFDSGVMERSGQGYTFRAPRTDVTIYYHCRVHGFAGDGTTWGSGMVGRIVVGAGSKPPRIAPDVDVRRVPSKRWPSIDRALTGLKPDGKYRVELKRGRYAPIDVTLARVGFRTRPAPRFELTIRGTGGVVFEGGDTGLSMSIDGIRIENVTFRRQRFASIFIRDVDRWSVDDVAISSPGRYGVWVDNAPHGRIRRTSIAGASVAGIALGGCRDCDVVVDSVTVSRSLQGLSLLGGGSVVVRGSTFRDNGVGIALKASVGDGRSQRGADVLLNTFRRNMNRSIAGPGLGPERDLPVGAGVWIDGGSFDVVRGNDFDGHSFGVVITGPAYATQVRNNTLTRSVEADVAWDGFGADVCFGGNVSPRGASASTMPPGAQDAYSCALPATAGIPFPLVTALVLAWGAGAV